MMHALRLVMLLDVHKSYGENLGCTPDIYYKKYTQNLVENNML